MKKLLLIIGITILFASCSPIKKGTVKRPLTLLEIKRDYGLDKAQLNEIKTNQSIERHYHFKWDADVYNPYVDYSAFKK